MASFYIPMSLSLASNLANIPPIQGLYSFVFNPLIYAALGTCPQMVVGPEAAGSLLTGSIVHENIKKGGNYDNDGMNNAKIAGTVTCIAGSFIFGAGIFRLGFLDNVLSRPFLRGFISAIGVVIFISQLVPEMGLTKLASHGGIDQGSCWDKLEFLVMNIQEAHGLTCAVSFGAFGIIMVLREIKNRLQPRYPFAAYIPDRFIVVVLSAVLAWKYGWDEHGLEILGDIKLEGDLFAVHFPFKFSHLRYVSDAFNTSLIIALLGFFESRVAAKSLGNGDLLGMRMSANRELVALGVANLTGGLFMALPAFGGYGRSKVNAFTGGKTPMSSVFLSVITLLCIFYILPYFHYLPKGVLSAMISVVAYSLVEEAPSDIRFFWKIRGWSELSLMLLIFATTVFWDLKKGIAVGIGLSVLRVIHHSTRSRIRILGRVPGTDQFRSVEEDPSGALEFIEGCLIVKIPEPLTFANTGDLRTRLQRLEECGLSGHPLPTVPSRSTHRPASDKNVIFDFHGVTTLDGAGAQVLAEIVRGYRERQVHVFFCRVQPEHSPVWKLLVKSGLVEMCGGREYFTNTVQKALKLAEAEDVQTIQEEERTTGMHVACGA